MFVSSPPFIYLIIYLYQYGLTHITLYFRLSSNILLFILLVKLFPIWTLEAFSGFLLLEFSRTISSCLHQQTAFLEWKVELDS